MILDVIVEDKLKRLEKQKQLVSLQEMKQKALEIRQKEIGQNSQDRNGKFYQALAKEGLSVIGEFKKASPSHGNMNNQIDLKNRIRQYSRSADAISCLTEEDHFHGSVEYLKEIREMTELPIIRKDFMIDSYQVYEAKVIGADAILLIAAILDDEKFQELYKLAYELGLDVLCEVHDEKEMLRMLHANVEIIGINNRNLKTFDVDLNTTKKLSELMKNQECRNADKKNRLLVSESGVSTCEDIMKLAESDIDAVLIGTVLMEAKEPEQLVTDFKRTYQDVKNRLCTDIKEIPWQSWFK